MQGQLHQHALAKVAHRGNEDRPAREAGVFHDLGHMLVLQAQRVQLERRGAAGLVVLDHRAAAAGVAAHRRQRQRRVRREQAGVDQRTHQGDGAGGVAAGVAHPLRASNGFLLAWRELGKPEHPIGRRAVGGGGVDDARRAPLGERDLGDHGGRLAGRVVVQAEDHEVDAGHELALGGRVLAPLGRDAHELDLGHVREALADEQSGGAGLAVDEYFWHGYFSLRGRLPV